MRSAVLLASTLTALSLAAGPALGELSITGEIELPGGEPAAGVAVELVAQTSAYEFGELVLGGRHYPEAAARGVTDADGRYELTAPEAGMWHLNVAAEGYRPMEFYFLPLLRDRLVPTLELIPETEVTVRVVTADGEAAAGAHVRAERPPGTGARTSGPDRWRAAYRQTFADGEGRARLGRAPDESLTVYAFQGGHLEAERSGIQEASVELRLAASTARTVRVEDGRGQPVSLALVRLGERRWPAGLTDEEGRIELPLPAEGEPAVHVIGANGGRVGDWLDVEAAPDETLTITLPPPDQTTGRLIDRRTRRGIAGGFAWVGGRPAEAVRVDSNGDYTLDLPRTESALWVWGAAESYIKNVVRFDAGTAGVDADLAVALDRSLLASGVVVDESGEPVPEATVTATLDSAGRRRSVWVASANLDPAVSDDLGRFTVGELHPDGSYVVRAHKPGFAPGEVELPSPGTDPVADLRIVLERGRVLVGSVVDESGEPVAGARIELEKALRSGSLQRFMIARALGTEATVHGFTDEAGHFAIPDLAPGNYDLQASASGYAPASVPSIEIAAGSTETDAGEIPLEPGAAIEGRVTDRRGAAIEGAQVLAVESMTNAAFMIVHRADETEPAASSDADGFFSVPDRRVGEEVDLTIRVPGYAQKRLLGVEAPTTEPLAIRLDRASRIRGEVVDESGRAVSGANVWVQMQVSMGPTSMSRPGGRATTADDGLFVIEGVDPGEISLSVQADGYREATLGSLAVEPEEDLENVRVVLEPGATISGRVTDASGNPVAEAMILLAEGGTAFSSVRVGGVSDGEGRYRLEGMAPGRRLVTARHDDFQPATREIEVELGENRLDIVFEGGAQVSGVVVTEGGEPVAGADVALESYTIQGWNERSAVSDSSGAFTLRGVPEGTFTLKATKEGFAAGRVENLEVAFGDLAGVEIRLLPGSAIVGRLIGLEPSEYASVQIMAVQLPRNVLMGRPDRDGGYRIDDVGPGEYMVHAQVGVRARSVRESVTVDAGARETLLDLEFESGLTLTGVVLSGGEPLSGVMLMVTGTDVASSSGGASNNEGRFEIGGLQPGQHVLSVSDFGAGLNHREEIEIQSDREIVVRVAAARVSGMVIDATSARAIAGAEVRLESLGPQSELEGFTMHSSTTTDSAGFFRFRQASAGAHRLVARKDGFAPTELGLTVIEGLDQEGVEILLEPTEGLRVFVTLPSGQPAGEFFAATVDPTGQPLTSGVHSAGPEGAHLSIPPGEWELLISTQETAVSSTSISLPSDAISVALQPPARLDVRVPELEGDASLAMAKVTRPDGRLFRSLQWTTVRAGWPLVDGRGAIPGLSAGSWRITVLTTDGRSWEGTATVSPGDNPELVLE